MNFSESGWNKIGHLLEVGQVEKEMDQENQMVQIWCGCVQFCL